MVAGRPKLCTARGESPLTSVRDGNVSPRRNVRPSLLRGWLYHWALLWRQTMARGRTGIEHLLRRAGFGASPADLASFDDMSMSGVRRLPPELRGSTRRRRHARSATRRTCPVLNARRRIPAQHEHRGCASAMAVPHGAHAAAAAGEDGALLAQPLRHGVQQDRRNVRRGAGHEDDGQRLRPASRAAGSARDIPRRSRLAASPSS